MLQVAEDVTVAEGRVTGQIDDVRGWSNMPVRPATRQLRLYLGDAKAGPMIWLFNSAPATFPEGEPRPEALPAITHRHRSPSFRIALGPQERQFQIDRSWFGKDDYLLLDANKVYTDPSGVDGFQTLLIFADRRGMHPANKHTAAPTSDELVAWNAKYFGVFGQGLSEIHVNDDQATAGVAVTLPDGVGHGGRVKGSIGDTSDWAELSDGSRIFATFMGDAATGPVVILSQNAAGAIESPAGRYEADTFRLIIRGGCTAGEQELSAGAFLATEAQRPTEAVVHGPQGSMQLWFVADRRCWRPVDATGAPVADRRLDEIGRVLAPFINGESAAAA